MRAFDKLNDDSYLIRIPYSPSGSIGLNNMTAFLFYLGFATLITHELDAIAQAEWKLLYGFRRLPEQTAAPLFIAVHVPALTLLLWLSLNESSNVQQISRSALSFFLIIHALLHKRLDHHPHNTFHSALSKSLIYGGGLVGLLYCAAALTGV